MLRKKSPAKVFLFLALLHLTYIAIVVEALEKPSIVVLLGPIASSEGLKMAHAVNKVFEKSGEFRTIGIRAGTAFSTFWEAVNFAESINADYMVYMDISIRPAVYKYSAILAKPKEFREIERYRALWDAEPRITQEAMVSLASQVIYDSKGKVTVYISIESSPTYCNVYCDGAWIGNTKEYGFNDTFWMKKRTYKITVCKPEYNDWKDKLKVEKTPTRYTKKARLKRK